jgi:tetratricopeptide (TPR) repeat protein
MSMPQRTRQHVVETESEQALRAVLPAEWTVAWTREDYGLDGRVEVFDGGFATGLAFGVQLKATDEPDLRMALKARVDVTALNYMSAQADPVLLVRFHAPTGRLYARWLHRKDVVLKRAEQKTVTVAWSPSDLLDRAAAAGLAEEVRRFRRFRNAGLDGVSVRLALDAPLDRHAAAVGMLLNTMSAGAGGFVRFGGERPHDADVHLTAKMLRVDMSVSSARIEFPNAGASARELAGSVLVACAVCLSKVGRPDVAAALVAAVPDAPVLDSHQVAGLIAAAFVAAGRWREASDLARHHRNVDGSPSPLSLALGLALILHGDDIPQQDRRHIADNLLGDAEDKHAAGDSAAGAAFYTAGNFLFHTVHDYPAALAAYEQAAAARADYHDQGYYLGELAAAQFETGHYEDSLDTYDEAIAADPDDPGLIARRADVLAHMGRYDDAIAEYQRYENAEGGRRRDVWALHHHALRTITSRIGTGTQNRTPPPAGADPEAAVAADALNPEAWIDTAKAHAAAGDMDAALDALLVACAYPTADMPEPWPLVLHVAHVAELDDLFDQLINIAWRRGGEHFVADVLDHNDALSPDLLEGFLDAFSVKIHELRSQLGGGVDIRFLHDDGTRDVISFRRSPPEQTS